MEEGEKMVALKKAYADIILNTAKEAAARIMISERKALCFQKDLFAVKEEALNMLLRLKRMMDSQITEVEISSLSQRRRIEQLEAQLHEAEDTVTDLRARLKGVQDDLEKMKNSQASPLDEQIRGSVVSHEHASPAEKLSTSEPILLPPLDSEPGSKSISSAKVVPRNERNIEDNICFMSEIATTQTPSGDFPAENYYDVNPDLTSIITRSKEPDLYRNGCTQRIRALERNLLSGQLPLFGQTDDHCSIVKNESTIIVNKTAELTCTMASPKNDDMGSLQEKPTGSEKLFQEDNNCDKGRDVKFFRRFPSRKRRARNKKAKVTLHSDRVTQACEPSTVSQHKTFPCPDNSMVESGEDLSRLIDEEVNKNLDSHLVPVSSLNRTDEDPQSGCMDGTGSDTEVIKTSSGQNAADENTTLPDKSVLIGQDSEVADSPGVPICKLNLKTVDVALLTSDSKDDKACLMTSGPPTQALNDKVLKYTFRRKRKKETLSCLDEHASLEKNTTKWRSGEKQSVAPEKQKSSLIMESSRDSRRLVLVARQLISLSEKRWWQ